MNFTTIVDARVVSDKSYTRQAGTSSVTKVRIADNPSKKSDRTPTRFVNAEAWGKMGEDLAKLSKGDIVALFGEEVDDKYTDKTGVERLDKVIKVMSFRVVKSDSFFQKGGQTQAQAEDDGPAPTDDTIPF